MRKDDYLYIKDCYTFAKAKGWVAYIDQIKEKQFEWARSYDTSVKKGYFLRLFHQNRCLDEFLRLYWPFGKTRHGQHEVTRLMTLAKEYDEYQGRVEI
ncbi:hypothetical protein [Vibrio breoganii]|uniref:hypothetical protein n=1 Tax=Vibrio breoganii TaxID=553239 RepID=UPI000C83087C|nr:hypothetical protein [Vibrio breoganii]PMG11285.1 hypothetical protein BCV00_18190 [Vibrio breoganii]PMG99554.1 hypothetical protein BCU79_18645 [Vibrio breoganii]